ncbi:beta-glucuronidase [Treponema phagedenis]|uniref:Beta-glucuronidase n=1 Tax=Treponema phagedenis TaxID=162 RepID=A0AAE6IRN6_TREPH|nr:beta-glucuronidase [Treponema phagedenis]QEJ96581.1 beta-glucuronidase [Treponema phagedenis]
MLYPITTQTRAVIDLGGIWRFKVDYDECGLNEKWFMGMLDTESVMCVPASYNDIAAMSDIRNHVGSVWYQRDVVVPQLLTGQRLVLRFGSVTHKAHVYWNGALIAEHSGGFTPFEVVLKPSDIAETNQLTVRVNNILDISTLPVGLYSESKDENGKIIRKNMPNFDFFNYAGIHRPVTLVSTPEYFIDDIILTNECSGTSAKVHYAVTISGKDGVVDADSGFSVAVDCIAEDGSLVTSANGFTGELHIENVKRWNPLKPYLYTIRVKLLKDGTLIDLYDEPYGIRTVAVKNGQFLINEKPFYFKGFGKHEDAFYTGRGFNAAQTLLDFNLMKWMGANSFRTSHYPYAEETMRLCDRLGIVVIDEVPAVGIHLNFMASLLTPAEKRDTFAEIQTKAAHETVIRELIERDKNHCCVVMWSIANEPETNDKGADAYFAPLIKRAKDLDPQKRPVTIVTLMSSLPETCRVSAMIDVLCLNRYYGWYLQSGDVKEGGKAAYTELQKWQEKFPDKPIMYTEFGADTVAGFHSLDPVMFTEEYQVAYLKANTEQFAAIKNFVGEHVWNFADFETSQNIIRVQGNKKGVFTRDRKPKMAAYFLKERWTAIPDLKEEESSQN